MSSQANARNNYHYPTVGSTRHGATDDCNDADDNKEENEDDSDKDNDETNELHKAGDNRRVVYIL